MNATDPAYEARTILEQHKRPWAEEKKLRARTRDGWLDEPMTKARNFIADNRSGDKAML